MTRDDWLDQFTDELIKLRPHVSHRLARTLALQAYAADAHPRTAARDYHARQRPATPTGPVKQPAAPAVAAKQPTPPPVAVKRVKRG